MWVLILFEIAIALALVLSVLWVLRPRANASDPAEERDTNRTGKHE